MKRKAEPLTPDQQALAVQFLPLLHGFARKKTSSATEYEDLLDHLYEPFLRAARGFKPEKGYTFQAWATRILSNAHIDVLRRRKQEVPLEDWHVEAAPRLRTTPQRDPEPVHDARGCEINPGHDGGGCGQDGRSSAVERALEVLREGGTLQAARKAAARELGKAPARSTVQRWARAAKLPTLPRGRPRKLELQQLAWWLLDPKAVPAIWKRRGSKTRPSIRALADAAEVDRRTVQRSGRRVRSLLRQRPKRTARASASAQELEPG